MCRVSRTERILFVLCLTLSILLPTIHSMTVAAPKPEPYSKTNGPYIDELVGHHISSEVRQLKALTDDEIDLIGDGVNPNLVPELQETEDINVSAYLPGEMIGFKTNPQYFRMHQIPPGNLASSSAPSLRFEESALVVGILSGLVVVTTGVYWLKREE